MRLKYSSWRMESCSISSKIDAEKCLHHVRFIAFGHLFHSQKDPRFQASRAVLDIKIEFPIWLLILWQTIARLVSILLPSNCRLMRKSKSSVSDLISSGRRIHAPASRAGFWSSPFWLACLYSLDPSES
jgi:hypothetical protein